MLNRPKNHFFNFRHVIVLAMLILAILFEKNLDYRDINAVNEDLTNQIKALQESQQGIYQIGSGQDFVATKDLLNMNKGDAKRVFLNVQSTDNLDSIETFDLKVYAWSDYSEQLVDTITLEHNQEKLNNNFTFIANDQYSKLVFRRDKYSNVKVLISGLKAYNLNTNSVNELDNLKSAIISESNVKTIYQTQDESGGSSQCQAFLRDNQSMGMVFKATSDTLSYFDFKAKLIGSGGFGDYLVEVKDIQQSAKGDRLNADSISVFSFNKDSLSSYFVDQYYRIPITARLIPGNDYYIGITNSNLQFNYFNSLHLCGNDKGDVKNVREISTIGTYNKLKSVSGLFFRISQENFGKYNNFPLLSGITIQDLGKKTGLYQYSLNGRPNSSLDIYELDKTLGSLVYYNNYFGGISANNTPSNFFTYKFDTYFAFSRMIITVDSIVADNYGACKVFYSFDNQKWTEIPLNLGNDSGHNYNQVINGDGSSHLIYIKTIQNQDDQISKNDLFFGISYLSINADLIMSGKE